MANDFQDEKNQKGFERSFQKPQNHAWCKKYSNVDKKRDIKDAIKIFIFKIRYLKILLGHEEAYGGEALVNFAGRCRQIQLQVNELLAEQDKINDEYLNGEAYIVQFEKSINELNKRAKLANINTKTKKSRVRQAKTIQEKLKILEDELRDEGFTVEDFERMMQDNSLSEEQEIINTEPIDHK